MTLFFRSCVLGALFFFGVLISGESFAQTRLYRLDCGTIHVSDLNVFSKDGHYPGQEKTLVNSCYLLQKGHEWLLWDTGLASIYAKEKYGAVNGVFTAKLEKTLAEQLKQLDLSIYDIDYVVLSHAHFDHAGDVNVFKNSKLIIQAAEYEALQQPSEEAQKMHLYPSLVEYFLTGEGSNKVRLLDGDADLFGDGTVKAISLPGHSPGHMALLVNLKKSGSVVLSGDQWHFTENYKKDGVPAFNFNVDKTLESSKRLRDVVREAEAKLIIQHDPEDNAALPVFPAFME